MNHKSLALSIIPLNRFLKSFIFISVFLITTSLFSQTVSIDDTSFTEEQLANQLVEDSCILKSNFTFSSNKSVANFNNNGGSFPISKGIIIRSGKAKNTEGAFTNTNLSTTTTTDGDDDLQRINELDGGVSDITDVGFLEFNFTPIGNRFNFNYIFASNEYGNFQCDSRDLFAIILTNISTGETINIAKIPESDTSISVKNIRDGQYNINCPSNNEDLFSSYYVNNTDNSTINMRGFTEILNASATVIPNNEYKIKFVIGDYDNSDFDSAVFIEAGSFSNTLNLGENQELCTGENISIDSGFFNTDNFEFVWTKDGIPLTETGTAITIDSPGVYGLTITSLTDVTCSINDEITISTITATKPDDITICTDDTTIDLPNRIDAIILNGLTAANYNINYYTTEDNANNNLDPITAPSNYPITNNTFTLWARLSNTTKVCVDVVNFNVEVNSLPLVDDLPDVNVCLEHQLTELANGRYFTSSAGGGTELFEGDIITNDATIYIYNENLVTGCTNETSFRISLARNFDIELEHCGSYTIPSTSLGKFYTAPNGVDEILAGTILTDDTTIYFYSEVNGTACQETQFDLIIHPTPAVDTLDDIITCESTTLAPLTNGNYYTGANGTGTLLNAGDIITATQRIYIYNEEPITKCPSEESFFEVIIVKSKDFQDFEICEIYRIPNQPIGKYYTDSTLSQELVAGTEITTSQSIYYFVEEITTSPNCTGYEIAITISPLPEVDQLSDLINCIDDLPTLPALVNGNYFTGRNGSGTELFAGDEINSTQTIYIYNTNDNCSAETNFRVTIKPIPTIPDVFDISLCEPYILPDISFGGRFFTESNGQGIELFAGDAIEETQDIYIYNQDTDIATCANEKVFTASILNIEVDVFDDVNACVTFVLPALTKPGNYYKNDDKTGLLNAGDIIDETQTIYIIGDDTRFIPCQNNSSFTVTVFEKPDLGVLDDIDLCGSVTLPTISIPNIIVEYYRGPNKTDLIDPLEYTITNTSSLTETQEIYVHAYQEEHPDCFIDDVFSITIYPLLDLNVLGGAICVDHSTNTTNNPFLIETGLDATVYDIKWYLEGSLLNPTSVADWNATKAGTYTIEATKIRPLNNADCNYKPTDVIIASSSPEFEIKFLTDNFSIFYAVEIETINQGLGSYQYALDDGVFQESNFFDNIKPGTYNITIKDLTGICNNLTLELVALDYPKFFTPNNDNKNDRWNIPDLANDLNATITIYDRYGKLINAIKPSELGWDGFNTNGNKMPSTDYWFVLKYTKDGNEAIFRSHFSLIRK
ncbi:choice-of-anchor L domain-containing protein [Polaribacter atrinae]|uniref:T9SS type B sorting domain-containing protein n=1 Tax=Polaribacter atrinae TaxID=1333662 RepID=UPI0030F55095